MATKPVQPTLTITIDDVALDISKCSESVQMMVSIMDDWRQEEADAVSRLQMTRAALRDVQNSIYRQIQEERQQALAAAQEMAANDSTEAPAEAAAPDVTPPASA